MTSLNEIVSAVKKLPPHEFLKLRRKMERMEIKLWGAEQDRVAAELQRRKITDAAIDRLVARRRREGRR